LDHQLRQRDDRIERGAQLVAESRAQALPEAIGVLVPFAYGLNIRVRRELAAPFFAPLNQERRYQGAADEENADDDERSDRHERLPFHLVIRTAVDKHSMSL